MKKKILYVLCVFCVLIFASFLVLKNGISISSVQFDFLKLEQLYIKLDKKLILQAKNISLNLQDTDENSNLKGTDGVLEELIKITKNIDILYMLVEEIDIANFDFKDEHMRIFFKNNDFLIDNNFFILRLSLNKQGENINADIKKLFLKDYNLSIDGNLNIDTRSEFYYLNAKANSHLTDFNASISYKKGLMAYEFKDINTKEFSQIFKELERKITLPKELVWWLANGAKGDFYHIAYLKGFADLNRENYHLDEIESEAFVQNVKIQLDKNMSAILIPELHLKLAKQRLDFNFNQASYEEGNLNASKVYLYDLFNKNIGIALHIQGENLKYDERLNEALKNYGFSLPFYQKSGKIKSNLNLKIGLDESNVLEYNGEFELENAALSLLDFNVSKAFVSLKQNDLSIKNASVKNDFLEANIDANIDLNAKKGEFITQISRLYNDFIDIKNQKINFSLDFAEAVKIFVPDWGLNLNFGNGIEANLNKVAALAPYSSLAQKFGLQNASNLYYKSENSKDFILQIDEAQFKSDFLNADKSPYKNDSFSINNQNDIMKINTKSNLISAVLTKKNKEIHINNLSYIYKKSEDGSFKLEDENINFGGANFGIILEDMNKTLQFDRIEASLNKGILEAKASKNEANFELYYAEDKDLKLSANNMNDEFINTFLQKQAMQGGTFNLNINGSGLDFFQGNFELKNTFAKDLKGINTLVSFIDTVPSLLLFKTPTFNEKGLSFVDGKVVFNRKKDLLNIESISLHGDSVDIFGLGSANLRLDTLDIDLELKTLKSASTAISKVPILNYVILGKDQEISTNLKVDGTFENPKFHTQILTDTLKTPYNLIKNIIQLPANLLN